MLCHSIEHEPRHRRFSVAPRKGGAKVGKIDAKLATIPASGVGDNRD